MSTPMFKFIAHANDPDYDAPNQREFGVEVNDYLEQGYRLLNAGHAKTFFNNKQCYGGYSWAMLVYDPRQERMLELEHRMLNQGMERG